MKGLTTILTAGALCSGLLLSTGSFAIQSIGADTSTILKAPGVEITFHKSKLGGLGWAGSKAGLVDLCGPGLTCHELRIRNTSDGSMQIMWGKKHSYTVKSGSYKTFTVARDHEKDFTVRLLKTAKRYHCSLDEDKVTCSSAMSLQKKADTAL